MSIIQSKKATTQVDKPQTVRGLSRLRPWLLSWEIYLIVLVAAFLRLYQINRTELDDDQAVLFRMAHDAVAYGLLPVISNRASIGIGHPPVSIYLFMLPAALSANPIGAAILVGILSTLAVLLTYLFTRRYFGRLAGIIAASLYATAAWPIFFARFIWQPNMLAPFIVLFLISLFWGGVERRKGWLFPALFLIGVMYQLHEVSIYLLALVGITYVLAPYTVRLRDLVFAAISLFVLFFPYLLWEIITNLADIRTLYHLSKKPAHIDNQAINIYQHFLTLYGQQPTSPDALTRLFIPLFDWVDWVVLLLLIAGFITAIVGIFHLRFHLHFKKRRVRPVQQAAEDTSSEQIVVAALSSAMGTLQKTPEDTSSEQGMSWRKRIRYWWTTGLNITPYRSSMILLLAWQIVPLLVLSRHTVSLHPQYFLMLMPGPFILMALFIARSIEFVRRRGVAWSILRCAMYVIAVLVIGTQLLGSTVADIDISNGKYNDYDFYFDYYNDLASQQHALAEADQLAQQQHFNRVYITTDSATQSALRYLAEQMHTPTTLFDAGSCLVLPNASDGPAVLLVGPYATLSNALLSQFATATLVDQPSRLGGPPYRLYIVMPPTATAVPAPTQNVLGYDLQLLDSRPQQLNLGNASLQVVRWSFLRSQQPQLRTTYNYVVTASPNGTGEKPQHHACILTAIRAGDQLLVAFNLSASSLSLGVQTNSTGPYNPMFGPLHLESAESLNTPLQSLRTAEGADTITISASS